MTQTKPPLNIRSNPKDEAVRKASRISSFFGDRVIVGSSTYDYKVERDLLGSPVQALSLPVVHRPGTPTPFPNEGPGARWPGKYPDAKK